MPRTFKAFRVHAHEPAHSPAQLTLHAFAAIRIADEHRKHAVKKGGHWFKRPCASLIARNAIAAATFRALPFKDDSHE